MRRGKYVTRSVYQKVCEENKKLLNDIRVLVEENIIPSFEKITTIEKWRKKFKEDRQLAIMLKAFAKQYLKEHPEFDIMSPKFIKP